MSIPDFEPSQLKELIMAKKKSTMKTSKGKTTKLEPLKLRSMGDAWAYSLRMEPANQSNYVSGSGDIVLQLDVVIGVLANGASRQIDVVLTSRGNAGPVTANQCAVNLQPGVSTPVTLRAIHHNPQPGTYKMKAIVFANSQQPPLLAELPLTGPADWTYTVR